MLRLLHSKIVLFLLTQQLACPCSARVLLVHVSSYRRGIHREASQEARFCVLLSMDSVLSLCQRVWVHCWTVHVSARGWEHWQGILLLCLSACHLYSLSSSVAFPWCFCACSLLSMALSQMISWPWDRNHERSVNYEESKRRISFHHYALLDAIAQYRKPYM